MQKKFQKTCEGRSGARMCKKFVSSFLNDLQKPMDVFCLISFFSTPPHTQVKNVTMSRNAAEGNGAPRVSKIVLLRHLRPKLLEINSVSRNTPAKITQKSHHRLKNHLKNMSRLHIWEKTLDGGQKSEVAPGFKK